MKQQLQWLPNPRLLLKSAPRPLHRKSFFHLSQILPYFPHLVFLICAALIRSSWSLVRSPIASLCTPTAFMSTRTRRRASTRRSMGKIICCSTTSLSSLRCTLVVCSVSLCVAAFVYCILWCIVLCRRPNAGVKKGEVALTVPQKAACKVTGTGSSISVRVLVWCGCVFCCWGLLLLLCCLPLHCSWFRFRFTNPHNKHHKYKHKRNSYFIFLIYCIVAYCVVLLHRCCVLAPSRCGPC